MKKIILLLVISLSYFISFAQTEQNKPTEKNWVAKLNATALVDGTTFPTVQFAVERKLTSYFSIQTEAGIQLYDLFPNAVDTVSVNVTGFRLMAESRFYLFNYLKKEQSKKRKSDGLYTGLQIFYRKNSYNRSLDYYPDQASYDNNINELKDDFGVKKEAYGINLSFGYQIPINNFVLEPYTYIGALKRNIKNYDRTYNPNLGHIEEDGAHPWVTLHDKEEDPSTGVNFSLGLRVGYKF